MSYIYIVGFGDTGRIKVGYSAAKPEARVEAHKRGARAYLGCDEFTEWVSPDHKEGVDNERALIKWCRERSRTQVGEYFSLPYGEVLEYAQSLPMTTPNDAAPAAPSYAQSWGQVVAGLARGNATYPDLREVLGEDGVHILGVTLNPSYALPPFVDGPIKIDAEAALRLEAEQHSLGLGMSYLDIVAGVIINKIRCAVLERQDQAFAAGRLDLYAQDYLHFLAPDLRAQIEALAALDQETAS